MKRKHLLIAVSALLALALAAYAGTGYNETVLYVFPKTISSPVNLITDSAGNYYGPAGSGGAYNNGEIYELSPSSSGWSATLLYSFQGGLDGSTPGGSLVMDSAGNLYGATSGGSGTTCGVYGCGQVYELSPSSSGWTKTVIHSFNTTDGVGPNNTLIWDSAGNLYGVTQYGGVYGHGTVFELSHSSSGWTEATLYSFKGGAQGYTANAPLVFDSLGRLYGTTQYGGGTGCNDGCGTIFQLSPPTSTVAWWTYRRLHQFTGKDGENPVGTALVFDAAGNLYGTAPQGGNSTGYGVVFQLAPTSSGGWKLNVLHSFTAGNDGNTPQSGVVFDASGNLWGTASTGGLYGWGNVFEMTPTAAGHWNLTNQHSFSNANGDGSHPQCLPLFDSAGNVYGTTTGGGTPPSGYGTFWELSPTSAEK